MTTLALFGSERVRRTYTPFVTKSVSHARVDNFSEIKGLDTGRTKKVIKRHLNYIVLL